MEATCFFCLPWESSSVNWRQFIAWEKRITFQRTNHIKLSWKKPTSKLYLLVESTVIEKQKIRSVSVWNQFALGAPNWGMLVWLVCFGCSFHTFSQCFLWNLKPRLKVCKKIQYFISLGCRRGRWNVCTADITEAYGNSLENYLSSTISSAFLIRNDVLSGTSSFRL